MNEWLSIITIIAMSSSASLATFSCHMPMAARIMAALMVVVLGWWLLVSLCFCCSTDSSRLYPAFHVLDLLITSSGARQDNLPSRRTHLWLAFFCFLVVVVVIHFSFRFLSFVCDFICCHWTDSLWMWQRVQFPFLNFLLGTPPPNEQVVPPVVEEVGGAYVGLSITISVCFKFISV